MYFTGLHILALIIILIGGIVLGFGIRASRTLGNQVLGSVTGRYTRRTMWYLIGGGLLIIAGATLFFLV